MMLERRDLLTLTTWIAVARTSLWCAAVAFTATLTVVAIALLR